MAAVAIRNYFVPPQREHGLRSSFKPQKYSSTPAQWLLDATSVSPLLTAVNSRYDDAAQSLDRLLLLSEGWDGYFGHAISKDSYNFALEALSLLQSLGVEAPQTLPYPSGTIGFAWENPSGYVSIDFDADGEFAYAAVREGESAGGVWKRTGEIPSDLISHLAAATK